MIWLYGDGRKYQRLQPALVDEELNSLLFNASQILISRAKTQAAGLLAAFSFMLHEATNDYNDEFTVWARVDLRVERCGCGSMRLWFRVSSPAFRRGSIYHHRKSLCLGVRPRTW